MLIAEHLVATTRDGARLLASEMARWLWDRLRHHVPNAFSCVLMPDHVHLVAPPGERERFRRLLTAVTARFGVRFDVLPEERANSAAIAARMIRYGFLNPVRAGLVDDPWAWPWSTLRDLGGAVVSVWTALARLAAVLGMPTRSLVAALTTAAELRPLPPAIAARLGIAAKFVLHSRQSGQPPSQAASRAIDSASQNGSPPMMTLQLCVLRQAKRSSVAFGQVALYCGAK